ncbi:MAG TPA: hypothetical protein PK597_03200 [Oscillospiraceae bacterium]|nr:hypothetical protein [Oscillospiraceae bacterium]
MKKTLTSLFLTLSLVLTVLSSSAFASAAVVSAGSPAELCYQQIESSVADAESDGASVTKAEKDLAKAEKFVADANAQIEAFVARAQRTPKEDIGLLLAQIDRVVDRTVRQVTRLGFGVACEYVTYEVDGQTVLVDPLKVVN